MNLGEIFKIAFVLPAFLNTLQAIPYGMVKGVLPAVLAVMQGLLAGSVGLWIGPPVRTWK